MVFLSLLDVYFSPPSPPLFGRYGGKDEKVVVMGVPFDSAATRTPGQRFAPRKIREVSVELETFSPELGVYVEELGYSDAGDLPILTDFQVMDEVVSKVVRELIEADRSTIVLGGDHLVSFPVIREYALHFEKLLVVVFDAHLDLRDEYPLRTRFSHATVMRRLLESTENISIAYFSPRAFSKEEYEYARKSKRVYLVKTASELEKLLGSFNNVYVSLDIDSIDPAFAPGTGTPEPIGLTPQTVASVLKIIAERSRRVVGLDLVEVNPLVDCNDITSLTAAKLIMEFLFSFAATRSLRALTG
ncbi:MAG: agmatinase [Infirmifilum sp.]